MCSASWPTPSWLLQTRLWPSPSQVFIAPLNRSIKIAAFLLLHLINITIGAYCVKHCRTHIMSCLWTSSRRAHEDTATGP